MVEFNEFCINFGIRAEFLLVLETSSYVLKQQKHIPQTQTPNHIQTHLVFPLSASMSLEEKIEAVLKNNQAIAISNQEVKDSNHECKAQNEYLRRQLGDFIK